MSDINSFLKGFKLDTISQIGGYQFISVNAKHEIIKEYEEYKYHITLYFHNLGNGNITELFNYINSITLEEKNNYLCSLDKLTLKDIKIQKDQLEINLIGHANRIKIKNDTNYL